MACGKIYSLWDLGQTPHNEKNTERHICRLCYYLLLKSKTELLHNFDDFKISLSFLSSSFSQSQLSKAFLLKQKEKKNSLKTNSWNVNSPLSYRKHTEQTHKFILPLLRSWCNRSIRATTGQKKKRPTTADQFKIFHDHCPRKEFAISL